MNAQEYYEWLQKFEVRKTSDDTFTPPAIYNAVTEYVDQHICKLDGLTIERPFYPGGDYREAAKQYNAQTIVIDNPPFSIVSQIARFYQENNIKFFLFAPGLTSLSGHGTIQGLTAYIPGEPIRYDNGAKVNSAFLSNLTPHLAAKTAPELKAAIKKIQDNPNPLPQYRYPANIVTVSRLQKIARRGQTFELPAAAACFVSRLDSQKQHKKAIYGAGLLISDNKAAELTAKEPIEENQAAPTWPLSEREHRLIARLNQAE